MAVYLPAMKPCTFTLILLFAGLQAFGQLRKGDVLLSFSDRLYFNPILAPSGLSDQISGIRTYPGVASFIHLSPEAYLMVSDRVGVGGELVAIGGLGGGSSVVAAFSPAVRYYFHNGARQLWYASVGPIFVWNDSWSYGVQVGGGLQIPVASSVLFSPGLSLDYGGERITPILQAGVELLLGNDRAADAGVSPELQRGSFLLGASSAQLSFFEGQQNVSLDVSAHYFLLRRFAVAGRLLANVYRQGNYGRFLDVNAHLEPGLGLRYYWNAGQPLLWFTDAAIDFGDYTAATLTGGVNYFVGEHLALEYGLFVQTSQTRTPVFGQSFGMRLFWGE